MKWTESAHIEGRKRKRNKKRFVLAASVWNKDTQRALFGPEVSQSANASPQKRVHTTQQVCISVDKHKSTTTQTDAQLRTDANTLRLIIMIKMETENIKRNVPFLQRPDTRTKAPPPSVAKTTSRENKNQMQ